MNGFKCLVALLTVPLVVACADDNNRNDRDGETAQLRLTHASPDAPPVNVYLDGELALEGVDFKQSSGLVELDQDSVEVEVRGILPDETEVSVIGPVELPLEEGERLDVLAVNNLFDGEGNVTISALGLDPVAIEEEVSDVRVTVVHAAPAVDTVDIFVTEPGGDIADVSPITAAFGQSAGPVMLEPGEWQVRITPTGGSDVVYDSGTLTLDAGTELVAAAVENTYKVGGSPVTLLAIGPDGAAEVLDVNEGGAVRVVHNAADVPPVDVLVDGAEVVDALAYPMATQYDDLQAPAGSYNVVVAADADNSIAPIDLQVELDAAESLTVIAIGSIVDSTVEDITTVDARRNIATAALLEVIHGSYQVAQDIPVDVYLTADGVIADAEPAIEDLEYGQSTDQFQFTPGDYWITVTVANDRSVVAFDTGGVLTLEGGVNYTIIARDPDAGNGESGAPLINVSVLTD